MAKVCVSIVSSDHIFSEGLRRILATDHGLTFVALTEQLPATDAVRAALPDVLLVDSRMDGTLAFCGRAKQDGGPGIILVAVPDDDASAAGALSAGARGILQTSARSEDVAKAVHVVANGEVWAPRRVIVAAWLSERDRVDNRPRAIQDPRLTAREMEVLHHAAAGRGNKEMANELAISESTVKAHLTRIFQKLGLQGRAQLAAAYHGIVPPTAARAAAHNAPVANLTARRTTFRHVVRRQAN